MVIETEILPYWQWLLAGPEGEMGALWWYLLVASGAALFALLLGYFVAGVRHGPMEAGDVTFGVVSRGLRELRGMSLHRVRALAWLAVQESMRRRIWVVLLVYFLILAFAGWFLDPKSSDPAKLYLSFVLTATSYLILILALLVSVFSLPADIKRRTIYTIVTKPVRAGEIVLGRMLGFTLLGTVLLAVMGASSYFFVVRQLSHTHTVAEEGEGGLADVLEDGTTVGKKGRTSRDMHHGHEATVNNEGHGATDIALGHWHPVAARQTDQGREYAVGRPRDMLQARVPIYGKLRFKDHTGAEKARGINVGDEWAYRSYISGGASQAAAIWKFKGLDAESFPEGLKLGLSLGVFRTHMGDIKKGVVGSLTLRNPETGKKSEERVFFSKEFEVDEHFIPRKLAGPKLDGQVQEELDLFDDLVHNGEVEIWLRCIDRGQYFGAAQADCYIHAAGGRFWLNFIKGYVAIWVQMVVVIGLGVMFSTFLSGPVAMLATMGAVVLGFFTTDILRLVAGEIYGGGPFESLVRLVTQKNVTSSLEQGIIKVVVESLDAVALFYIRIWAYLLPNFQQYSNVNWVAEGFDISANHVAQNLTVCLGYLFGVFVAGYFFLRVREVAK